MGASNNWVPHMIASTEMQPKQLFNKHQLCGSFASDRIGVVHMSKISKNQNSQLAKSARTKRSKGAIAPEGIVKCKVSSGK